MRGENGRLIALDHWVLDLGSSGAVRAALKGTRAADFVLVCESVETASLPDHATVAGVILHEAMGPAGWAATTHAVQERWPAAPVVLLVRSASSRVRRQARLLGVSVLEGTAAEQRDALVALVISAHMWRLQQCARVEAWCSERELSRRDRELALLAAFGMPREQWTAALGISASAISGMLRRIRERSALGRTHDVVSTLRALVESIEPPQQRSRSAERRGETEQASEGDAFQTA